MSEKLSEYNKKRDFKKTSEPKGISESKDEGLRFCVQHHLARRDHYDFRLEWKDVLLSWAVPKGPSYNPQDKRLSVHVEDHPYDYRNFEGTIPKGEYGGGTVMLWDEGLWEPSFDVDSGLKDGVLKFNLNGVRLKGKWSLIKLKDDKDDEQENWLLLKEKDEYAKDNEGISEFTTSVRTGRTMTEIEKGLDEQLDKNPFNDTPVQLAKLVDTMPNGNDWLYELKFDGYRIIAFIEGNSVRLMTRNGKDYSKHFKDVVFPLIDLADGRAMVLDGEMASMDNEGKTDFQALQNNLKNPKGKNLTYIIFDLLALDGKDLRGITLIKRKEALEALMENAPKKLFYSRHVLGKGRESLIAACEAGMEGIIGKKVDSAYSGTRNGDWIKFKCKKGQELVIGGYALSGKKTSGVSSVLLGFYEGDDLIFAGRAGTGFSEKEGEKLEKKFDSIKRKECPFKEKPKSKSDEKIFWVEPQLIAEIKFAEWTKENLLRQASYKGLRTDKNPKEVKRENEIDEPLELAMIDESKNIINETITINNIKITNPDKIIFDAPKTTKLDVIRYYDKVSQLMLPYLSNRILSIVRCPKGITDTCFYKKHPGNISNGIVAMPIDTESGKEEYFYIENKDGLIFEAQMGTLEFHIWGSHVNELEKPDMMVFDLDPDEGMTLDRVRQGVKDLKSLLDQLSLTSFLKTSGGKGYHIVVPFKPTPSWEAFRNFALKISEVMAEKWPDRYTTNIRKAKRVNRIFIDWQRNGRGATSIAPYSLRARKGAGVSMPIAWDELDVIAPDGINISEALKRLKQNPWKDYFTTNQTLN